MTEDQRTLAVSWSAFRAPRVAVMPAVFGTAESGTCIYISATGSQSGGPTKAEVVIGNGPPTDDPLRHVTEVVRFLRILADAFGLGKDACAAALADHLADLDLGEAEAEHAAAARQREAGA